MSRRLLEITGLRKRFDGIVALDGFSCALEEGEIIGLIGPNGAGKTTLFDVVTGFVRPEDGKVAFKSRDLVGMSAHRIARAGVARTFQNVRLVRRLSVLENVLLCFPDQPGELLWNVFFRWRMCRRSEGKNYRDAMELLSNVGLMEKANDLAEALSYGQQKLLNLACCLATRAELLLLDEPVAGIAPEMTEKVLAAIQMLRQQGKSVIFIEHDLEAVTQVCPHVIFMDAGMKVSEGTPEEVRNDPRVIEAYIT